MKEALVLTAERAPLLDGIEREASEWLARRRLTRDADDAAFEAWLAADPRHAATYEAMAAVLEDVASLRSLAELEPLEAEPTRIGYFRRRSVATRVGAIAAALAAVVALPVLLDRPDIEASTLIAEVRPITLPDGTRVTLGAKSEIKVRFDDGERRVQLTSGEAFFEVADDPARPFVVDSGGAEIRDIGTKFEVKRVAGGVEVGVLEGIVEVGGGGLLGQRPTVRRLLAGQKVTARDTGLGPIVSGATVGAVQAAPAAAGAWREGQLTYDDTALVDVVADLNRYYAPGVRLDGAAPGQARLAASFKVHEIDKFLQELPGVAPVVVKREEGGAITITRRPDAPAAG
jgi:transmembrane sensor